MGSSLKDTKDFPINAKKEAGYQLSKVQNGLNPDNWKPMKTVGSGAREICIECDNGWFRIFYVAKFQGHIYVLHAFKKKTNATPPSDIKIGRDRYKKVVRELKEKGE